MKFAIEDLVVVKKEVQPSSSHCVSKVVAILDGALLVEFYGDCYEGEVHAYPDAAMNKPGSRKWQLGLVRYQEEELFTVEESRQEQLRLQNAKNKLDDEFGEVRDQLEEKLNAAAVLVKEAATIATAHKRTFYDLKHECMPLYEALDDGGWSESHMRC